MLKIPQFMSLDPTIFKTETFQVPETDHHSTGPPSSTFSKYDTALTTLRWRYSPSKPDELQSNARILRWSDGSLTLQLASDPTTQYTIDGKPLAPPQPHPTKPTPNAAKARKESFASANPLSLTGGGAVGSRGAGLQTPLGWLAGRLTGVGGR